MNDPNSFGFQEGTNPPVVEQTTHIPMGQHKFTPDEMRVLKECNRESFVLRSLPLSTMLGLSTFMAVQNGHLRPNTRFGAVPKVSLAMAVGYFLGKLSYQQVCAEKLMALPGSYLGQLLRERKEGGRGGGRAPMPKQSPSMFGAGPNDIYSDAGPGSSLNMDTDRPMFNEDSYRPDSTTDSLGASDSTPGSSVLSYEDLRRKNREEHAETKQDPYKTKHSHSHSHSKHKRRHSRHSPPPPEQEPSVPTNKYGDIID